MNAPHFIARRIVFGTGGSRVLSQPVVRIALAGVALGVAVMVSSVMIMNGFKKEITGKVAGFGSHIRITQFNRNASFEEEPVDTADLPYAQLRNDPDVKAFHVYATKAGIVKTDDDILGIVLKGVDRRFNWRFFDERIRQGGPLSFPDSAEGKDVLISTTVASLLKLKPGDDLVVYFIGEPMRVRKFRIAGIYETGLEEFDRLYVFCDLRVIRRLNGWNAEQVGGMEVVLRDLRKLDDAGERIYRETGFGLKTETLRDLYPQVFNWLDLVNINVLIIIVLMVAVAGLNMVATLLIIILDKSRLVGVLKSLGAADALVRRVFLYVALYVIGAGVVLGNGLAYGLAAIQRYTGLIRLPQESYYVSSVPVDFSWGQVALLNAGTVAVCVAVMLLPAMIIARISPVRVLRFD